jgi:hypothetical protein
VEQFVRAIVAGGISLVAGLWLVSLFEVATLLWILGTILVAGGIAGLGFGIRSELEA